MMGGEVQSISNPWSRSRHVLLAVFAASVAAARFLPRGDQQELAGRVIRLSRVSPSNLAIQPSAGTRESYHVAVFVPKLADGEDCLVGRTGRLKFDDRPSEIAPVAEGQHPSIT
jgi:hypothetical protein